MGIVILGAGGLAREVYWNVIETNPSEKIIFLDDYTLKKELYISGKKFDVITDWNFTNYSNFKFVIGVGDPTLKRTLVTRALSSGLTASNTIIHPKATVQDCEVGVGGVITAGCVITTNVKIGNFVVLNLNSTVGHDSNIHDFVQVNPGCHISGNVTLEEGVSLGTGTTVIEKIKIAKNVKTGAQAAVVKDILESGTYVGVPAKSLQKNKV